MMSAHWYNCAIKVCIATFRASRELEENTLFVQIYNEMRQISFLSDCSFKTIMHLGLCK